MKKISLSVLPLIATIILASCGESNVRMHTTIHKDGSCEREVSYSTIMSQAQRDSLWQGNTAPLAYPMPDCLNRQAFMGSHTDVDGDTVTTTLSRGFRSVEDMCKETPLALNGTQLHSTAKFEKHFRWFYTEYTFQETISCVGDTFKLSATDYADKDVVSYWFTGQPNLVHGMSGAEASEKLSEMEPKITHWLNDNLFKTCFDYIVNHYDSIANPPVSRERFIELRDSLAKKILQGNDDITNVEPAKALSNFFHSDAYAIFFDENTPCGKGMNDELANRMNILWFSVPYTLSMPGTITDAGTGIIKGNVIYYPLTGERLIPADYVISATSRVTNIWAYILTSLIVLLALASFFIHQRSKGKLK